MATIVMYDGTPTVRQMSSTHGQLRKKSPSSTPTSSPTGKTLSDPRVKSQLRSRKSKGEHSTTGVRQPRQSSLMSVDSTTPSAMSTTEFSQNGAHCSSSLLSCSPERVLSSRPIETTYIPREDYVPGSPSTTLTIETLNSGHTSMSMSSDHTSMPCDHECLWGYDDDEMDSDDSQHIELDGGDVMSNYLNMLSGFSELFAEDHQMR